MTCNRSLEIVHILLGVFYAILILYGSRERNKCLVWKVHLLHNLVELFLITDCVESTSCYQHGTGFAIDFIFRLTDKRLNNDTAFLFSGSILKVNITGEQAYCLFLLILTSHNALGSNQLVVAFERHVVFKNIEDKTFINGLFHRIHVEWFLLTIDILAEKFDGLRLGCSCKCKVTNITLYTSTCHFLLNSLIEHLLLVCFFFYFFVELCGFIK